MRKFYQLKLSEPGVLLSLFIFVFSVYLAGQDTTPLTDTRYTVHIALSILREGNIDLDEYPYSTAEGYVLQGHRYSYFPVGTSFAITPFIFAFDRWMQWSGATNLYEEFKHNINWTVVARVHLILASLFTATSCSMVFKIGRLSLDRPRAFVLTLVFAFGTSAWTTASRDLWQHTLSVLLLTVALYVILRAQERPDLIQYAALPLASAFVVRPTNSISVAALTVYILVYHRSFWLRYLLWALPVSTAFIVFNISVFGNILPSYFAPQRLASNPHFLEALAGNLISPARGLLIYSPVFVLLGYSIWHQAIKKRLSRLDYFLIGIVLTHWLAISSFAHWWGGASYGPRLFTDMIPYLIYFLIPVLRHFYQPLTGQRAVLVLAFCLLSAVSFSIHARGALDARTWEWNGTRPYVVKSVDAAPDRLWDWSDPQFWRGLRPARLAVQPTALCFSEAIGETNPATGSLLLLNQGDRDLVWDADWPYRAIEQPAETHIPALGYGEARAQINLTGLPIGTYQLGGIYLTAASRDGSQVRGAPVVIPVGLQLLADGELAPAPAQNCNAALSDVWLNSQPQAAARDQSWATYGTGWYDLEQQADFSWRWAASPAQILVTSPTAQHVVLSSTLVAAYRTDGVAGMNEPVVLFATNARGESQQFLASVGQVFAVELSLVPGWNALTIASEAGNVRPAELTPGNGDQRKLSFALGKLDVVFK